MKIYTPYWESYIIHEDKWNAIERTDMKSSPSLSWTLRGFYRIGKFNHLTFVSINEMKEIIKKWESLLFKNWNPRYTYWDCDYWTNRITLNWDVHWIKYISL